MTEVKQIYKCKICGNVIEVVHSGADALVCCGEPMTLMEEKSDGEGSEKHVPAIDGNIVRIGGIDHPMTEEHYIEWVEATDGKQTSRIFLKPGDEPLAEFSFIVKEARAYCNLHGLWKSK